MRFLVVFGLAAAQAVFAQSPGDRPPAEISAELRSLGRTLESEMNAGDRGAVEATVARVRTVLGPYAGVPESPERYATPINIKPPAFETVAAAFWDAVESMKERLGASSEAAGNNQTELREHAYFALAALTMAELAPAKRGDLVDLAHRELDYLVARQDTSGLFPYPANPGERAPENVRRQVARMKEEHPEALRDGYMYLSIPDMQFDVGCVGVALCAGYAATGDERYRESAERAADWALDIPMSWNWNYNAFSVWLLARTYAIRDDARYLDGAVHKAQLGVLPGLMESGRWVDQHNAKQSYHFIMVRALSDLLAAMPENHPYRDTLQSKLKLAADSRVNDILEDGVSNFSSAIWGLSTALKNQAPTPRRWDAAHAIVNAILAHPNAPGDRLMLPFYLQARAAVGGETKPAN